MSKSNLFKWRHYQPEIILLCIRWYLTYPLSYRQVAEMISERGWTINHTTIYRARAEIWTGIGEALPVTIAPDKRLVTGR